jgi:hypothetical protein
MSKRYWFVPRPDYDGPPIELICGHHTKSGRFIPKNVRLTPGISRLSYARHMAQKRNSEFLQQQELPPDSSGK